jgi:hypothetical protein
MDQTALMNSPPPQQTNRRLRSNSTEKKPTGLFEVPTFEFKKPAPLAKVKKSEPELGLVVWRNKQVYVDKHGNEIFSGKRDSISWLNGFYAWYQTNHVVACAGGMGPCSVHFDIDHISSFYRHIEKTCSRHAVCDGKNHWDAYITRFASEVLTFPVNLK